MKTTIHLPDDLVVRAKAEANRRRTSLRAVIERGLRRELETPSSEDLEALLTSLHEELPGLWQGVDADEYVDEQRSGWDD